MYLGQLTAYFIRMQNALLQKNNDIPLPNIYILSYSSDSTWTFISQLICSNVNIPLNDIKQKLKYDEDLEYFYSNYLFVVKGHCIKTIRQIVEQKCIVAQKHFVIINITEKLRANTCLALQSIINKYSNTTTFIFIENEYHKIPSNIKNLLFRIVLKDTSKNEPVMVKKFVIDNIEKLYNTYKSIQITKDFKKQFKYFSDLRSYCVKLGAGCIPIGIFAKYILEWKANATIVSLLADLDHSLKKTCKYIFSFEYFIGQIIEHCYKNDL